MLFLLFKNDDERRQSTSLRLIAEGARKCEATEVNGIGSDDLLKTIYY